jgi:hypothetical protein
VRLIFPLSSAIFSAGWELRQFSTQLGTSIFSTPCRNAGRGQVRKRDSYPERSANFRAIYPVFVINRLAFCSSKKHVISLDGRPSFVEAQRRAASIKGRHDALAVCSEIYGAGMFAKV